MIQTGQAREIRVSAGLSQDAIAEACDVSQGSVMRWESGLNRPRGRHVLVYHGYLRHLAEAQ